jgi:hypothetical protein
MLPIHSPQLEILMPSQARKHRRHLDFKSKALYAKAGRLHKKVLRKTYDMNVDVPHWQDRETALAYGHYGRWAQIAHRQAMQYQGDAEDLWWLTPDCGERQLGVQAQFRLDRSRAGGMGYNDTTAGWLNSSACR